MPKVVRPVPLGHTAYVLCNIDLSLWYTNFYDALFSAILYILKDGRESHSLLPVFRSPNSLNMRKMSYEYDRNAAGSKRL